MHQQVNFWSKEQLKEIEKMGGSVHTSLGKTQSSKPIAWASLVAQWLRIHLPMQGTWVRALVWEDPTCHGATKPVRHSY